MEARDKMEERRRKFPMQVSLGHLLAILTILATGVGVYTQLYADVSNTKIEITNIKQNQERKDAIDKEFRDTVKQEVREVKQDVKSVNEKIDKVLFELRRGRP